MQGADLKGQLRSLRDGSVLLVQVRQVQFKGVPYKQWKVGLWSQKRRVGVTVFFSFSDGDTRNLMDEVSLVQLSVDTFLLEI